MINFKIGFSDVPENADELLIVNSKSNVGDLALSTGVAQKLDKVLSSKENGSFVVYEADKRVFVIIHAKEETDTYLQTEALRLSGAEAVKALEKESCEAVQLKGMKEFTESELFAFLEGMSLAQYRFEKYKKAPKKSYPATVFLEDDLCDADQLVVLQNIIKATEFVKDLVNEPVNFMDALKFSEAAKNIAAEAGFTVEVLDKSAIKELKMGGLLAVNQGSETPPTFNIFTHKPENAVNERPLVLVGKGVMFDTGGYSIKISGNMSGMKGDMAGGAAVLGTMVAIALNKLPYYVIGLVPATDNKISPNALVVDDIITMHDGTTVEVQNTDAEGRLVLADALSYAKKYNPELVIDLATLTGAASAITGSYGIAMAGNNKPAMERLQHSGEVVHERLIQLPFWKEFAELLKSDVADLKNVGGRIGGASVAGKFLEHFTDYPWIHLDIAGAATIDTGIGYKQSGATACGVRLLVDFIKNQLNNKKKDQEEKDII
ncbi:MAG: leucyl aminopeptidase [Ginsengibacter sp.]